MPSHRRRIGYVFQDARLFPHLTVRQNLRYGRWFTPPAERYADMRPRGRRCSASAICWSAGRPSLSGGEKQRVAIGRALLASPRLLLMDEPLASLDEARKAEILPYIERLRDETAIPIVYVSHSVAEVARLASDIVMLAEGRVVAAGPTSEHPAAPRPAAAAERGEGGSVLEMLVEGGPDEFGTTTLRSAVGALRVTGNAAQRWLGGARTHPGARRHDRHRTAAGIERAQRSSGRDCQDRGRVRPGGGHRDRLQRPDARRPHHRQGRATISD